MASGDFFDSYSGIAQWPGALPSLFGVPGSIPGVDSATFFFFSLSSSFRGGSGRRLHHDADGEIERNWWSDREIVS